MRRVLILLIALALAGCTQGGPSAPSWTATGAGEPADTSLSFRLADLPAGSDWAILELAPLAGQELRFEYRDSYPLESPLKRCVMAQVEGAGFSFLGTGARATVAASPLQREPVVDQSTARGGFFDTTFSYRLQAAAPVQVLVAYEGADDWAAAGATLDLDVSSTGRFQHRVVAGGTLDCLTNPFQFPEGDFVETSAGTWAKDLRAEFAVRQSGFGWVFVSSDLGYSYRVAGPDGALVEEDHAAGQAGDGFQLKAVPAGDYAIDVTRLAGQAEATAAFIVADLPEPSAVRFSRPPGQPPTSP